MSSNHQPSADDHRLAADLAKQAGIRLVGLRQRLVFERAANWELKEQGDRDSHAFLMEELQKARPDDPVLSEEGTDDASRLDSERVWIIDPLDGTQEFSEPERMDWAVHVGLAVNGQAVCGAVALPALEVVFSTAEELPEAESYYDRETRIAVSRTRPSREVAAVATALQASLVPMGSAGVKAISVVRGVTDVYVHSGGQYEWDSCAPAAIAAAEGCVVCRLDGTELRYNQPDPWLPDWLVCRRDLYPQVRKVLDSL